MPRRWNYRGGLAHGSAERDIGNVSVNAVVTKEFMLGLLGSNAGWVQSNRLMGQIANYRAACMAVDAEAMLSSAAAVASQNPALEVPTALIVHPDHMELFTVYSLLMARHGICRGAFSELEPARAWLQRQALIHQAWVERANQPPLLASATRIVVEPQLRASSLPARQRPTRVRPRNGTSAP